MTTKTFTIKGTFWQLTYFTYKKIQGQDYFLENALKSAVHELDLHSVRVRVCKRVPWDALE